MKTLSPRKNLLTHGLTFKSGSCMNFAAGTRRTVTIVEVLCMFTVLALEATSHLIYGLSHLSDELGLFAAPKRFQK